MGSPEQYLPTWALWAFVVIGYFVCMNAFGKGIAKITIPLWKEAQNRDKRIELVSASVAIFALFVSGAGLAYTIRQVDSITDRLSTLEKTIEGMKAKTETPKP